MCRCVNYTELNSNTKGLYSTNGKFTFNLCSEIYIELDEQVVVPISATLYIQVPADSVMFFIAFVRTASMVYELQSGVIPTC